MELTPGAMVTPSLRLERLLGVGGMGSVWVAQHLGLDTEVAVKFVLPGAAEDRQLAVTRFQREAKAAAKITSPHCVRIYDHGFTADSTPYIVMELLHGESLRKRLQRDSALPPEALSILLTQVAKALTAAHKLAVVHRDIKPENIFLVDTDEDELFAKVLDFGVARQTDMSAAPATATGTFVGTPKYMAPELLVDGKPADLQADLWALAVTAYVALTGREPFVGDSLVALCLLIDRAQPEPPSEHRPELSTGFDAWFARAFTRDPASRFASAKELASSFAMLCQRPRSNAAVEPSIGHAKTVVWSDGQEATTTPIVRPPPVETAPRDGPAAAAQTVVHEPAPPPPVEAVALGGVPAAAAPMPLHGPALTGGGASKGMAIGATALVGLGVLCVAGWWLIRGSAGHGDAAGSSSLPVTTSAASEGTAPPGSAVPGRPPGTSRASASSTRPAAGPLIAVPAGDYWLGCMPDKNRECYEDERPGHRVALAAFRIMRHEVTVADYQACVAAGPCPALRPARGCVSDRPVDARKPVNCVDWNAARAYCQHRKWRLPTEAEWEAAALGKDHPDFPWGSEPASCVRTVVADPSGPGCGSGAPLPAESRSADRSWVGVLDLGGNVREWTGTDYAAYPGGQADSTTRGKVNRGGSYLMKPGQVDTSHTRNADPSDVARPDLGFRCAADS